MSYQDSLFTRINTMDYKSWLEKIKANIQLYDDIKIMANNTKYVFTKQVAKEVRRKIRNKIWLRLYKYLILLYDATNESTNLIDFDSFQKIADISDDTLNRIRPELKKAWIIKRLKIKWARWWYLNPLVLHWWNNEKIKFLYKHFREKSLQEYA